MNLSSEHLRVLLNHLPLVGLMQAAVVLVVALALRNRPTIALGLALVSLTAGTAWPVIESRYFRKLCTGEKEACAS